MTAAADPTVKGWNGHKVQVEDMVQAIHENRPAGHHWRRGAPRAGNRRRHPKGRQDLASAGDIPVGVAHYLHKESKREGRPTRESSLPSLFVLQARAVSYINVCGEVAAA